MKSFRSYLTRLDRSKQSSNKLARTLFATTLVAGSQLLAVLSASANPVPTPSQPTPVVATRVILNGSFEAPAQGSDGAGYGINEGYVNTANPVIWQTTEPGNAGGTYKDQLELWRGINTNPGGQSTSSGAGSQYAEINASTNASIYQDICVLPKENVPWSLLHAARKRSSANPTNIMQVSITDPAIWSTAKTPPAAKLYTSGNLSTTFSSGWKSQTGSWMSTNTSIKALRFAFEAIQGSDGDVSYGNFVDDIKLNLSPLIDFLPTNGGNVNLATTTEGNPAVAPATPPYYYLSLRINGITTTPSIVKINLTGLNAARQFTLGAILKGSAPIAGLTATTFGNEITLTIPAGTYDVNVASNYIHIPIDFSDTTKKPNDNLLFTLTTVTGGGTGGVANLAIESTDCASAPRLTVATLLRDDDYVEQVQLPLPLTVAARRSK
jgi:hypothetical protein